jgi:hypothetical protein
MPALEAVSRPVRASAAAIWAARSAGERVFSSPAPGVVVAGVAVPPVVVVLGVPPVVDPPVPPEGPEAATAGPPARTARVTTAAVRPAFAPRRTT